MTARPPAHPGDAAAVPTESATSPCSASGGHLTIPQQRALDLASWLVGRGWVSGSVVGAYLREAGLTRSTGGVALRTAVDEGLVERRREERPGLGYFAYRSAS